MLSYSKKPPERACALPEVFELALELVQFHGGLRYRLDERGAILADRLGQHVVDQQLQAPLALVFVDVQAVNQPGAA